MISHTEQGKKHQPSVKIEKDIIIISIGRDIEHPMQKAHLIETIDILQYTKAGLVRVKEIIFTPENKPEIEFPVSELKSGTYKVQARCNLHGTWEDNFTI